MYRILIVDDEPLVQIGLKSMLSRGFEDMNIEIAGTASNGKDALEKIGELHPDIVIADIKMPVMTGLELLKESGKKYGPIPTFIMLTAYEEFDLVRQAISLQAVDYLIKIELNAESLRAALEHAISRVEPLQNKSTSAEEDEVSLKSFRQQFLTKLLSRGITDHEDLITRAHRVNLELSYNRYIAAYAVLDTPDVITEETNKDSQNDRLLTLYASCLSMTKEIVARYADCYVCSNDLKHFTLLFYFSEDKPVAGVMQQIQEAISNAHDMIQSYFNVPMYFGVGTAVTDAMDIPDSFEEAQTAAEYADSANPVRLFSHIVGANRRSGKDKLIEAIQEYIDENLEGKLQLNEVAKVFGLSPAYLSMIFKKTNDIGFSEYVYTKKIEKAKDILLSDDMKIYEVADALGFESAYYFSRVFKKVEGMSPREYIAKKSV